MVKKIFAVILLLIIVAFAGLTYYVSSMDWNVYKQDIADKFSEATGKKIDFKGPISVSLLPQPKMSANDIVISNNENKELAKIQTMNTSVDLLSILQRKPTIKSMTFEKAEIWIEQDKDGSFNWQNNSNKHFSDTMNNADLQNLTLHDTTIYYQNKAVDIKFQLNNVTADVQASSITGPYKVYGTFTKENEHFGISMSLGSISSLDDIDVNFGVTHPSTNSSFKFEGSFNPDSHNLQGNFSGESEKTADFVNNVAGNTLLRDEDNVKLQFSLDIDSADNQIKLSRFTVNYGGMIEGSGDITIPLDIADSNKEQGKDGEKQEINIKYNLINFDVRPLVSVIKAEYENYKKNGQKYNPQIKYNAKVDIAAQKIILNDTDLGYFENITLRGSVIDNIISLDEFYAAAAGNTAVSLSGSLKEQEEKPVYYIKTAVISENFQTFINSLGIDLKAYTQSTYRNADLSMEIIGTDSEISSESIKLVMDKMNISASADISNIDQESPSAKLDINVDSIIIDNYLPKTESQGDFIKQLQTDLLQLKKLSGTDAQIRFGASEAIFRSTKISGLKADVDIHDNTVKIASIEFNDIDGTSAAFSGSINQINTDTPEFNDFSYNIKSKNLYEIILQTNMHFPSLKLFNAKTFSGKGNINGTLDNFDINSDLTFDDAKFNYSGNLKNITSDIQFNGRLSVSSTNYGALSNNLGLSWANINNRGALNLETEIIGNPKEFIMQNINCKLGVSSYTGTINFADKGAAKDISGSLSSPNFDLEYIFDTKPAKNTSSASLYDSTFIAKPHFNQDKFILTPYQNLNLNLEISGNKGNYKGIELAGVHMKIINAANVMKIHDISLIADKLAVSGDMEVDYSQITEPKSTGTLKIENFDIANIGGDTYKFLSGNTEAEINFSGKGDNYESILNTISGTINLSVSDLKFMGFDFSVINSDLKSRKYSKGLFQVIRDNLQVGESSYRNFKTEIAMNNGTLSFLDTALENESIKLIVSGNANIKSWQMETNFNVIPKEMEDKAFSFSLSGPINKPTLDINIEGLVKSYDEYWEEVKKAEDLKLEQQRKELESKMSAEQQVLSEYENALNARQSILDEKFTAVFDENEKQWYNDKKRWCAAQLDEISQLKLKASTPNFTENDVASVKQKNEVLQNSIAQLDDEISRHYAINADILYHKYLNEVSETIKSTQQNITEYRTQEQSIMQQLKNKNILSPQQSSELAALISSVENDSSFLEQSLNDINVTDNTDDKYNKLNSIVSHIQRYKQNTDAVKMLTGKYLQILHNALNAEKAEQEKMKAREQAEQQEENPFNNSNINQNNENVINISSTANKNKKQSNTVNSVILKKVTEEKEISESAGAEDNTEPQTTSTSGIITKNYQETQPEKKNKSGLLKEVDGAVVKATGTINIK